MFCRFLSICYLSSITTSVVLAEDGIWTNLFNGKDLDGWTVTHADGSPNPSLSDQVSVEDGIVHVYKDVPTGGAAAVGVISRAESYSHYQMQLEYRWMGKRYGARAKKPRSSGLLYHMRNVVSSTSGSLECQIQEGSTGDIIFRGASGVTGKHYDEKSAPSGEGAAGMLPEWGGQMYVASKGEYVGRFDKADHAKEWNTLDVIVHGDGSAVHMVNGKVLGRVHSLTDSSGLPLKKGSVGLRLEGAEMQLRKVRIKALEEPLRISQNMVSVSAVKGLEYGEAKVRVTNPHGYYVPSAISITGKDAELFRVVDFPEVLGPHEERELVIHFTPKLASDEVYGTHAGIQIGKHTSGGYIHLKGLSLPAAGEEGAPPLNDMVKALGIPVNVGTKYLHVDVKNETTGDSIVASYFKAIEGKPVKVTPVAKFSSDDVVKLFAVKPNDGGEEELADFVALHDGLKDRNQRLYPPMLGGKDVIEFSPGSEPFALSIKGPGYHRSTDLELMRQSIIWHCTRIYPVDTFQGRALNNGYFVGFENSYYADFQDLAVIIENVEIGPLPERLPDLKDVEVEDLPIILEPEPIQPEGIREPGKAVRVPGVAVPVEAEVEEASSETQSPETSAEPNDSE